MKHIVIYIGALCNLYYGPFDSKEEADAYAWKAALEDERRLKERYRVVELNGINEE